MKGGEEAGCRHSDGGKKKDHENVAKVVVSDDSRQGGRRGKKVSAAGAKLR